MKMNFYTVYCNMGKVEAPLNLLEQLLQQVIKARMRLCNFQNR